MQLLASGGNDLLCKVLTAVVMICVYRLWLIATEACLVSFCRLGTVVVVSVFGGVAGH